MNVHACVYACGVCVWQGVCECLCVHMSCVYMAGTWMGTHVPARVWHVYMYMCYVYMCVVCLWRAHRCVVCLCESFLTLLSSPR